MLVFPADFINDDDETDIIIGSSDDEDKESKKAKAQGKAPAKLSWNLNCPIIFGVSSLLVTIKPINHHCLLYGTFWNSKVQDVLLSLISGP